MRRASRLAMLLPAARRRLGYSQDLFSIGWGVGAGFPGEICSDAFTDTFETGDVPVELEVTGFCGFRWSPGIGIGFSI